MVGTGLVVVEARLQVEDGSPVLDRDDPSGREAPTVADPVDLVQDRHRGVARSQEVGVQRVDEAPPFVDGASGGDERLAGHLAAEDALAVLVRRAATEDVDLDRLEIEQRHQVVERTLACCSTPLDRSATCSAGCSP
jgi:hypothetical protein